MEPSEIKALSGKIDELLTLCQQLRQENRILRTSEQQWKKERAQLIEKNEMARVRVEAMIGRLKALEHES